MKPREPAPLADVLRYANPAVVASFTDRFAVDREHAQQLFEDVLRWLWLCGRLRADLRADEAAVACRMLAITPSMRLIDEMWHTFMLFSADYRELCEMYMGGFIDHVPERASAVPPSEPPAPREAAAARLEAQLEYVHDQLGEPILRRWYIEYADRHTPDWLDEIAVRPSQWSRP